MNRRQRRSTLARDPLAAGRHNDHGIAHLHRGELNAAIDQFQKALSVNPRHAEVHCNLGLAFRDRGNLAHAADHLEMAIAIKPELPEAHNNLGLVFKAQEEYDKAAAEFLRAIELRPGFADARANLAAVYEQSNRMEAAKSVVLEGLDLAPGHSFLNLIAAKCERREGQIDQALARLDKIEVSNLTPDVRPVFQFERGRLHDRAGNSGQAFECFVEGNRLARQLPQSRPVDQNRYLRMIDKIGSFFVEETIRSWTAIPDDADPETPVFLIGFPRSGTTLLDQILDSHPRLQTIQEQPTVNAMQDAVATLPDGFPRALAYLSPAQARSLRATYFEAVDKVIERRSQCIVVDKHPLNIVLVGLIQRVFPRAKFILAMRHPCDVCLSCLMQNFRPNDAMANLTTLDDAAALYARVMDLWRQYLRVLPLAHHVVKYEDLVDDFESETRKLLDFLDVGWDDAVLDYMDHASARGPISTPSYHQVVRPIYRESRHRWRRYTTQLEPVTDALAPYIEYFGYGNEA